MTDTATHASLVKLWESLINDSSIYGQNADMIRIRFEKIFKIALSIMIRPIIFQIVAPI